MSPQIVFLTFVSIFLHLQVGSVNHALCLETTTSGETTGGGKGGPVVCPIRSTYVNPYQTYLVRHQCTTRAHQHLAANVSLASAQLHSFFSFFVFSDDYYNSRNRDTDEHLEKGKCILHDDSISLSHQAARTNRSTFHFDSRPCAVQLTNIQRRRRRKANLKRILSRSMLQYGTSSNTYSSGSCLSSLQLTSPNQHQWSPANVELFQAVAKVTILVLLKLLIKYYIRGYLKARIASQTIFALLELASKALTIAIAKCAIKWALYPAFRTAAKTALIHSLRSFLKPITTPLIKGNKKGSSPDAATETNILRSSSFKFALSLAIKVVIKTTALEMLVFVFENEATQLPLHQLMARVTLILLVKMSAKRVCKMGKQRVIQAKEKQEKLEKESKKLTEGETSAPVDKMLMFAIQKLVTKLVKIPLIKMLL